MASKIPCPCDGCAKFGTMVSRSAFYRHNPVKPDGTSTRVQKRRKKIPPMLASQLIFQANSPEPESNSDSDSDSESGSYTYPEQDDSDCESLRELQRFVQDIVLSEDTSDENAPEPTSNSGPMDVDEETPRQGDSYPDPVAPLSSSEATTASNSIGQEPVEPNVEEPSCMEPGSIAMQELAEQERARQEAAEALAAAQLLSSTLPSSDSTAPDSGIDDETPPPPVQMEDLKFSLSFIQRLRKARIANDFVSDEIKAQLSNPPQGTLDFSDHPDILLAIKIFKAVSSREPYENVCAAIKSWSPTTELPSYYRIKKIIYDLTGVTSISTHMCVNSCLAFVCDNTDAEVCPECSEPRYDQIKLKQSNGEVKVPRKVFHTIPIGPVLQALWRSVAGAKALRHRLSRTLEIIKEINETGLSCSGVLDDVYCSEAYIEAVRSGKIKAGDMVLMFSIDGAQLYAHKTSDAWIWIWVLLDLPPELRYKKEFVIPAAVIPGPNKPKHLDSFLFVGLHHVAALQHDGLALWDAVTKKIFSSDPWVHIRGADGPGAAQVSGLVPHHGVRGCRLRCNVIGRRKAGGSVYYPALLKPLGYELIGSNHYDFSASAVARCSCQDYRDSLVKLLGAQTDSEYKELRKETGIVRSTILLGLSRVLQVPDLFPSDLMHHAGLNLTDLFLGLWRGTLDCDSNDSYESWHWAVLKGSVWKQHGKDVAAAIPYLPGCFGDAPRNISDKVSSGYKASEFETWFYVYGPAMLYGILPEVYWRHFCKLVLIIRLVQQRSIPLQQVQLIYQLCISFVEEFEELYYQRIPGRLHFNRQSIHGLLHLASQIIRIGPQVYYAQWTMERTIGNLGQEIRLHSNPFANLAMITVLRAQFNALEAAYPFLTPTANLEAFDETEDFHPDLLPHGSIAIEGGYVLLRAADRYELAIEGLHAITLASYWQLYQTPGLSAPVPKIRRWARLRLPNSQVARSLWREGLKPLDKLRISRNVKIEFGGATRFAEVHFFFQLQLPGTRGMQTLAMVSLFSPPDPDLLDLSHGMVLSCRYQGMSALRIIPVSSIQAVVGMVPHPKTSPAHNGMSFYVAEKLGLETAVLRGVDYNVYKEVK